MRFPTLPRPGFKAALCALTLTVLSSIVGCTPKEEPVNNNNNDKTEVPVSEISLDHTSLTIRVGETATLTATISPSNATSRIAIWTSSNISVATVDNGKVKAVAIGEATVTATAGGKSATCSVTVKPDAETAAKTALMKIYDKMDGAHWSLNSKWDVSKPLNDWECVEWDPAKKELHLTFGGIGLKGEFPDCFDDLTPLTWFIVQNEPGVTGTLPSSFGKLKNLTLLAIVNTSMTGLPDVFKDVPLTGVLISGNKKMTGPLPESLPGSKPTSVEMTVSGNAFTGTVPDSWARLGSKLKLEMEPYLDARVPDSFLTASEASYLINLYIRLAECRETPIAVGDYDIPAYWPKRGMKDIVTGKSIPYQEICARNKVTVLLNWATWCPFSKEFMPILKRMYERYHEDGLEIIAAFNASSEENDGGRLKEVLLERGYDQWYNFNIWDFSTTEWSIWCAGTPSVILVDKDGNTIASCRSNVSDPARNRFGYKASTNLIPLLESIFGPVEGDDNYASTDYSQDGKVITIQKATVGKGINLVFMGDAYTDKDIKSGVYEQMMRNAAEQFFSIEPYKTYKNRFNVYAVKVVSKNGRTGTGYTTALGTQFVNGWASTGNEDKIYQYALKVSGISKKENLTIGVLVNSIYHGGIASMSESLQSGIGYYSSNGNDPSVFGATIRHEVGGHAFAFLADEYANDKGSMPQASIDEYNKRYKEYGWYANIDFTDDPKTVKWADFLSDSRYNDKVGVFEGGANFAKGVYRPSGSSMMNDNIEYYNAPSRWAIYQRIMKLSGETPTFSKFLEYDAVNR